MMICEINLKFRIPPISKHHLPHLLLILLYFVFGIYVSCFFSIQIVCVVHACFDEECDQVKCPTVSKPYKPQVIVSTLITIPG